MIIKFIKLIKILQTQRRKHQNKCWYNIGSPPPAGSKKVVFKLRSVNNIVIAPAKTGNDNNNNTAVTKTDQTNNGKRCISKPGDLIFIIVVIKLIAPNKEDKPAKCKLNIAKSTDPPECASIPERGGYTVQPVPAPTSTNAEDSNNIKEGGNNQKLILFNLGKAISGAPIIKGTNQLPNPLINAGINIKKIITNAWAVIKTLNNWKSPFSIPFPGLANSIRIITENNVPIIPANAPNII